MSLVSPLDFEKEEPKACLCATCSVIVSFVFVVVDQHPYEDIAMITNVITILSIYHFVNCKNYKMIINVKILLFLPSVRVWTLRR